QLSPSCYKRLIIVGLNHGSLRQPFLGSIRCGIPCASIPLSKNSARKSNRESAVRETLGNYRGQSQQSRMELGLRVRFGLRGGEVRESKREDVAMRVRRPNALAAGSRMNNQNRAVTITITFTLASSKFFVPMNSAAPTFRNPVQSLPCRSFEHINTRFKA